MTHAHKRKRETSPSNRPNPPSLDIQMAHYHHRHHQNHQNHHSTTTNCCCHPSAPPCPHPSPPPSLPATDPFHIASLVAHLLQTQTPQHPYSTPSPLHHQPPTSLSSLVQRIETLESSLHHYQRHLPSSSSSSLYLRNAAARVIQTHFRRFLVRRSRTLRQLQQLSVIKSELVCLKSSFSRHNHDWFVDFVSFSDRATDLLFQLDSVLGGDQMIRDSKESITREILQFSMLVDGLMLKRHQSWTRKMRKMGLVRNANANASASARGGTHGAGRKFAERGGVLKSRNVDRDEKMLITSLRERVEKIGWMSRALEEEDVEEDEVEGFEHFGGKGHTVDQIAGNGVDSNVPVFDGKKRVCFAEDGNMIRVYTDGDKRGTLREVEEMDDAAKGGLDEEEPISDAEKSSQSSEDTRNHRNDQVDGNQNHDEFSFSA